MVVAEACPGDGSAFQVVLAELDRSITTDSYVVHGSTETGTDLKMDIADSFAGGQCERFGSVNYKTCCESAASRGVVHNNSQVGKRLLHSDN